ncbi:hypothetical protein [Priestia megaterium]|uniref:hypothetical protein n=1 Tax=Priestia megaterium TaxID=1404 RepID=UPI0030009457
MVEINNRKRCQSCGSPGKQNQHKETIIINNQVVSNTFPNGSLNLLLGFPYILTIEDLAPPPSVIPLMPSFAVDPGAISGCLYRYTYIWPRNGRPYWFYPTFVGGRSVAGYRWTGFFWVYAGVDVNQIREFQCV